MFVGVCVYWLSKSITTKYILSRVGRFNISGGARLLLLGADWTPAALVPEIKNK